MYTWAYSNWYKNKKAHQHFQKQLWRNYEISSGPTLLVNAVVNEDLLLNVQIFQDPIYTLHPLPAGEERNLLIVTTMSAQLAPLTFAVEGS